MKRRTTTMQSQAILKASFLKVILLGDGLVGKTSLMNRFVSNKYSETLLRTIGVEFLNKDLMVNNQNYTLQIWDTAGQEQFKSLRTPFYRGSDVCLLVFSLTNRESFENLEYWKNEFYHHADIHQATEFPFVLLGNKCDATEARVVGQQEIDEFVKLCPNMEYYETSAKLDRNVERAFVAAIEKFQKFESDALARDPFDKEAVVDLKKAKSRNKSCPC